MSEFLKIFCIASSLGCVLGFLLRQWHYRRTQTKAMQQRQAEMRMLFEARLNDNSPGIVDELKRIRAAADKII